MSFLTGPRLEIVEEYTRLKQYKGRFLIPIGPQELKLDKIEFTTSGSGNKMIVLTIRKKPEVIEERKLSFHAMKEYFVNTQLKALNKLILDAFNVELRYKTKEELLDQLDEVKGQNFKCIIAHQKRLIMEDGKPVEKKSFNPNHWGQILVAYDPVLWKIGTDQLEVEDHKRLIIDFNPDEKEIFIKHYLNKR